ncbi:hypothetical protein [Methanogenium cariaci]
MKGEIDEESLNRIIKVLVVVVIIAVVVAVVQMSGILAAVTGQEAETGIHGSSGTMGRDNSSYEEPYETPVAAGNRSTVEITAPYEPEVPAYLKIEGYHAPPEQTEYQLNVTPIFNNKYHMLYKTVSLKVDVVQPPLVIDCGISKKRGDMEGRFLDVTVSQAENRSRFVEKEHWLGLDLDAKQVIVRESGVYYVDLYGNQIDLNLTVSTGA